MFTCYFNTCFLVLGMSAESMSRLWCSVKNCWIAGMLRGRAIQGVMRPKSNEFQTRSGALVYFWAFSALNQSINE